MTRHPSSTRHPHAVSRAWGHGGSDYLEGGAGDDVIWGGAGSDHLAGLVGSDVICDGVREVRCTARKRRIAMHSRAACAGWTGARGRFGQQSGTKATA
jgi:Ca2+-binding RTX toxin-like protein